ncbi:MAG: hypothetical protein A2606_01225 [Candidatus Yanofskybacteria bacterium RIFOXYD1_FULL_42_10]|uniref:Uncharacterized protein n=1 Tax=Candidatus Yanofskybacteria bacterium RIFOXYD1_FULL_42_10 TaxID=1802718 RepID=A0A1F8HW56_9BACT|nr:MAG: hypothetical protein A2606_01225 [Candidatus Yanofskybacteria bacterium RIFOXYD1_FULL_42_10]
MKRIAPIHLKFVYQETKNCTGVNSAYNRIFELARKRIRLDKLSTLKYSDSYEGNGAILNTRGDCGNDESGVNNCLPNVSIGKATSDQVWKSLADKQKGVYESLTRERKT